jgi:MATE family multidrug resistance protein
VQHVAMVPMRMVGAITPIIAIAMILSEALFGAGNPRFVAIAQFILIFGCLVPAAHFFAITMHMGLIGIWIATCIYATLAAAAMSWKFHQGAWKTIKL